MSSALDRFRRSWNRLARGKCFRARRGCRPAVERLENYRLLASAFTEFAIPTANQISQLKPSLAATTTTTLSSSASTSTVGQMVTFTAAVTSQASGTPSGSVQFYGRENTLVLDPIDVPLVVVAGQAEATFTVDVFEAGPLTIHASYNGDTDFASSTATPLTVTVNSIAATTTTTLSAFPNPARAGQPVTFTAAVTSQPSGTPTGIVTFTIDGVTQPPIPLMVVGGQDLATFPGPSLGVGTHTITATYSGESSFDPSKATPLTQIVNAGSTNTLTQPPSIAGVHRSKQGLTSFSLGFVEALNPGSANNTHLYLLLGAVQKHGRTVFSKKVGIQSVRYKANTQTVRITLTEGYKGVLQVTIKSGLMAAKGASSLGPFSIIVT